VDTAGGAPRIAVTLDTGGIVYADYLSGSGTSALTFRTTVANGQLDTNGISLGSSLDVNGGTVRDSAGNNMVTALNSIASTAGVMVDAVAPAVSGIQLQGNPQPSDQSISFLVTFDEAVAHVDLSDFSLSTSGGVSATINGLQQVDAQHWVVVVGDITGAGSIRLDVKSATDIADPSGNTLASGFTTGAVFTSQLPPVLVVAAPSVSIAPTVVTEPTAMAPSAPLIVLTSTTTEVGGATNTPLTTLAGPNNAVDATAIVGMDTSPIGTDPIGSSAGSYAPSAAAKSSTIERLSSGSDALPLQSGDSANLQTGVPLSIPLPGALNAADSNQSFGVEVRMQDGRPLVPWLRFDPTTGALTGQAPKGFEGKLQIQIIVRDSNGVPFTRLLQLYFTDKGAADAPDSHKEAPVKTAPVKDTQRSRSGADAGKPALKDQFAGHGESARQREAHALLNALSQLSVPPARAHQA
jgi:hypothetical protein